MSTPNGLRPSSDKIHWPLRQGPSYPEHPHHYIYSIRKNVMARCYNPKHPHYHCYGGRGIYLYGPWKLDCHLFIKWILDNLGERPSLDYSLDRRDNDGHYVPGNLRWATAKEQANNRIGAVRV